MMQWLLLGISLCAFSGVAQTEIMPDKEAGREKSQICTACHNADGNSTVPAWPKIAGQSERYLIEQLEEFRKGNKGTRFEPTMYASVQGLSDQDIVNLAAYFADQKGSPGTAKQATLALGQKIYRGGNPRTGVPPCSGCHSPEGLGNGLAGFPALSGQQSKYIMDQLKNFKNNTRSNDPNGIMRDIAKRMTEEEMQAVSDYVSGLH